MRPFWPLDSSRHLATPCRRAPETVYYVVPAKEQLKQSEIDGDKNGVLKKVSKKQREAVVAKCKEAQLPQHYCMYVKEQKGLETMSCQASVGSDSDGIERPKPECTSDFECDVGEAR